MSARIDRERARRILALVPAPVGGNFYALRQEAIYSLLAEAKAAGYRTPRNANGSRARYFHEYLQRAAQRPESES